MKLQYESYPDFYKPRKFIVIEDDTEIFVGRKVQLESFWDELLNVMKLLFSFLLLPLIFFSFTFIHADVEKYHIRSVVYVNKSNIKQQIFISTNIYSNIINSRKFIRKYKNNRAFYTSINEIKINDVIILPTNIKIQTSSTHQQINLEYPITEVSQKIEINWKLFAKDFQPKWFSNQWNLQKMNLDISKPLDEKVNKINPYNVYLILKAMHAPPIDVVITKKSNDFEWKQSNQEEIFSLQIEMEKIKEYIAVKWILFLLVLSLFLFKRDTRSFIITTIFLLGCLTSYSFYSFPISEKNVPKNISNTTKEKIFLTLQQNIYKAFDYKNKSDIYDILAESVSGKILENIYLEVYESVFLEAEKTFVIKKVTTINKKVFDENRNGFKVRYKWLVKGWVIHMGHRHLRTNKYDAIYTIENVNGFWRITDCKTIRQMRLAE